MLLVLAAESVRLPELVKKLGGVGLSTATNTKGAARRTEWRQRYTEWLRNNPEGVADAFREGDDEEDEEQDQRSGEQDLVPPLQDARRGRINELNDEDLDDDELNEDDRGGDDGYVDEVVYFVSIVEVDAAEKLCQILLSNGELCVVEFEYMRESGYGAELQQALPQDYGRGKRERTATKVLDL